ncbi:MAG: Hsp20/alpha crystallin family protein [Spirochaetaceae bacterium]|jgi:HSP20 family molecular chaperone IbpA|nr:Hsp20/alpha crystallin family protein [Spirochaetaceae bacterium]
MKSAHTYMDLGTLFDQIFEAAQDFTDEFHRSFDPFNPTGRSPCGRHNRPFFDETVDYYPNYSYPPMNVSMTHDKRMIFEFALAGFDEKNISLSFQGDYMIFSARIETEEEQPEDAVPEARVRYFKRRLKLKDIERQKYYVPQDKYAQENVKAVFRNGILKVVIPPKAEPDQNEGIKIEIIKEGD